MNLEVRYSSGDPVAVFYDLHTMEKLASHSLASASVTDIHLLMVKYGIHMKRTKGQNVYHGRYVDESIETMGEDQEEEMMSPLEPPQEELEENAEQPIEHKPRQINTVNKPSEQSNLMEEQRRNLQSAQQDKQAQHDQHMDELQAIQAERRKRAQQRRQSKTRDEL
eukprot:TRINITY_DN48466_c0_g1_i1.p1 TRINITY_DN48466_c0_g1~~TRINITY_DN48466_c0_g1_i1.p1  ORF type:complete len:166 (+),score=23.97 TRINITY_DN48466_c0_g1_i1:190-687(+)